jgi:hypothetical protein
MEALLELLVYAVLAWRFALCFLLSALIAFFLNRFLPSIDTTLPLVLVIIGSTFGIYWHGRAESGVSVLDNLPPEKMASSHIGLPVAVMGLVFSGFILGMIFLQINNSVVVSAVALLFCFIPIVAWQRWILNNPISSKRLAFAYALTLAGLFIGYAFLSFTGGF